MRFLILVLACAGLSSAAYAADEFGARFADQTPPALQESPQDIEPAAGDAEQADEKPAAEINNTDTRGNGAGAAADDNQNTAAPAEKSLETE